MNLNELQKLREKLKTYQYSKNKKSFILGYMATKDDIHDIDKAAALFDVMIGLGKL